MDKKLEESENIRRVQAKSIRILAQSFAEMEQRVAKAEAHLRAVLNIEFIDAPCPWCGIPEGLHADTCEFNTAAKWLEEQKKEA